MHVGWLGLGLLGCSTELSGANPEGDGAILPEGQGPVFGEEPGSGSSSGYFAGRACAGQTAEPEAVPSVLQLVVDTSGSMNDAAPGVGFGSKWTVTRRAVLDAIDGLPDELSLGVVFYPNRDLGGAGGLLQGLLGGNTQNSCFDPGGRVPIDLLGGAGSPQRQRIEQAFESQSPDGGTPTHDAYRYGLGEIDDVATSGGRFLVLITDGVPTYSLGCQGTGQQEDPVDPSPLIAEAGDALERAVRTFVIGSPGSEGASASLSRMAEAGGTAALPCSHVGPYCHLDMTAERDLGAGLANALGDISRRALSCEYAVPQPGAGEMIDPNQVNVIHRPANGPEELIRQSLGSACEEGWRYADDATRVSLCPSTCERVRGSDGAIALEFGCVTEVQ